MSLFRRKKVDVVEPEPDEEALAEAAALAAEDEAEEAARRRAQRDEERRREQGPHDVSEVEADAESIDLGALRLSPHLSMELRLEVAEEDQSVRSVTAVIGESQVQLQVFSAPRVAGVWDEVRAGLAEEIARQGGTAEEQDGCFGQEILARLPIRTPDGRTGHQATRFVGVDGPRWFLRAVVAGEAAMDSSAAEVIEEIIKGVVVVRGSEAQPPLELLPLMLPRGASRLEPDADEAPALAPPERGPEIAEVR